MTGLRRSGGPRGVDPNQFQINWGTSKTEGPPSAPPLAVDRPPKPTAAATSPAAAVPLVQRLPWDFRNSFPQPTPEAFEAGVLIEEEIDPEKIKSIHEEHAREALIVLHDLDAVLDARRQGFDPKTGATPTTRAGRERLKQVLERVPAKLEHWFRTLMDTYEEAFGADAAGAFEKALRAWHAGIPVMVEPPRSLASTRISVTQRSPARPCVGEKESREPRRIIARLPVPKPLPSAVAAGHFGQDESGRPIKPGAMEVRVITERHAEKLIDISDSIQQASGSCIPGEADRLRGIFQSAIAAYAEDFGSQAARQLEAYVRREAGLDPGDRREC
jgi:hypothetical protein